MCCDADWKREIVPDHKVCLTCYIAAGDTHVSSTSSTSEISTGRISSLVSSKSSL
jgi:hypothetical protein